MRRTSWLMLVGCRQVFWWLDYFPRLQRQLRREYCCLLENDRLLVFDLRPGSGQQRDGAGPATLLQPNDAAAWEKICLTPVVPVRELSSPVARAVANLTAPGDVLLEAGCGSGTLSAELATAGRVIELCDFSQAILDRAAEVFRCSALPLPRRTRCDLTRPLPWRDGEVDLVWSSGVLEHWTDEELIPIVREMARISRAGVLSLVPSAGCVFYRFAKYLAEETGRWPYGRESPRRTLRPVFERAGLTDIQEFTVWTEWGPKMLGLVDLKLERLVEEWWNGLPPEDPVKEGQGYLLLTVGYVGAPRRERGSG